MSQINRLIDSKLIKNEKKCSCENSKTKCIDSRPMGGYRYRRYKCSCGYRYSSSEFKISHSTNDPIGMAKIFNDFLNLNESHKNIIKLMILELKK